MKKLSILAVLLLIVMRLHGQSQVGSWTDHLSYNTAKNVAVGIKEVYASTGSSVIVYNKEYAELKKLSRLNGLTETGISSIAWSEENEALVIGYSSTNVDIVKNNLINNIPDISKKYIPGKKEINRIRINGKFAYLACSFGIVIVDIINNEIYDTWKPGNESEIAEVWDVAFGAGKIYAATGRGVFSADLTNPGLSYFGNWSLIDLLPDPSGNYTSLIFSGNKLYVNRAGSPLGDDTVLAYDGITTLFSYQPGMVNISMDPCYDGFTISSKTSIRYFNTQGSLIKTISSYGSASPNAVQAIVDNGDIWIADINSGLIRGNNMENYSALSLPGPVSNNVYNIFSSNGKTVICGGAADDLWNNLWRPLQLSIHQDNGWNSVTHATVCDPMRTLFEPNNDNRLFVSTWGGGLLEYEDNILVNQYTETNSPLQTIIPGKPYVRICGLALDKHSNLWITQTGVPGSIKILKPDGSWIVNPVTINAPIIGDLIITATGQKWIILPGGYGLFILDDNNTPDVFSDDRYKNLIVEDYEKQIIPNVYSIAEDLDGNIWVGTDQGPVIYYNPEKVFDENIKASRIKISRNDGSGLSDYLLRSETITSIAVDGSNRKWLGTSTSGAYYLSQDGLLLEKNFTEQNSPILSNSIVSIAVDNKSGEIWFGTSKGIQSYRGNATSGAEEFTNVYTFPNPVRSDFGGNVTITGLIKDSQIIITDISGNLVYETVSDGGQATWDLKTYNKKHVATGVYLIFCSNKDGSRSFATKMLVIK